MFDVRWKPKIGCLSLITSSWTPSRLFDVHKWCFDFVRCLIKWCSTHHWWTMLIIETKNWIVPSTKKIFLWKCLLFWKLASFFSGLQRTLTNRKIVRINFKPTWQEGSTAATVCDCCNFAWMTEKKGLNCIFFAIFIETWQIIINFEKWKNVSLLFV